MKIESHRAPTSVFNRPRIQYILQRSQCTDHTSGLSELVTPDFINHEEPVEGETHTLKGYTGEFVRPNSYDVRKVYHRVSRFLVHRVLSLGPPSPPQRNWIGTFSASF